MQAIMGDVGDWHSDAQAVATYEESAMRTDAGANTVALINPAVVNAAQIAAHFGSITYDKGNIKQISRVVSCRSNQRIFDIDVSHNNVLVRCLILMHRSFSVAYGAKMDEEGYHTT